MTISNLEPGSGTALRGRGHATPPIALTSLLWCRVNRVRRTSENGRRHIHRDCYISAYASHEFFCVFCNLIGGTQKSDLAQNPNSSYTRPFPSHGVAQSRERGWLTRLPNNDRRGDCCSPRQRSRIVGCHVTWHNWNR